MAVRTRVFALAGLVASLWLVACSSPPTSPASSPPAATPTAPSPPPRPTGLAVERQWLQSWFEGTPVRIVQRSESTFSIDVPREFCFDPGRSDIKPPLAGVLDKLAQSLQRKPAARVQVLAAPEDARGSSPLARQRADQMRKYLSSRGVAAQQLGPPTASTVAAVQLRIGVELP